MKRLLISLCMLILSVTSSGANGADWTQFRGPGGLGTSSDKGLPDQWSSTKNVVWQTELPGLGTSSPIVLGDRVFLTCYSGYGVTPSEGDMNDLMRHVVCLNRKSGKIIWTRDVKTDLPESKYSGGNSSRHGYSSSTPTTDGERLYVFFGKSGVFCFDLTGELLWNQKVGDKTRSWGSSNSPVLYQNLVIINASVESGSLVALNKMTGEEVWSASGIRGSWNTPLLVEPLDGPQELVVCVPKKVLAFDPATGQQLWNCEGIPDRGYVCPSAVAEAGVVYVIGGRTNTAIAIRAGGRGDVTDTHELWRTDKGSNVASPVYHDGHIYWAHEARGMAYCLNAVNGEIVYEERLTPRPGLIYSSGTVVDGKLYYVSQNAGVYVVAAKPDFQLIQHNVFEDDESRANACPVVSNGQLLLRNDRHLYCIGQN